MFPPVSGVYRQRNGSMPDNFCFFKPAAKSRMQGGCLFRHSRTMHSAILWSYIKIYFRTKSTARIYITGVIFSFFPANRFITT